ncbi:hypothetical protein HYR99_11620 [Candidatus Poribacteria bacterium]|nr:hypothetical protein [Candidatus Poribacteria bacterium]
MKPSNQIFWVGDIGSCPDNGGQSISSSSSHSDDSIGFITAVINDPTALLLFDARWWIRRNLGSIRIGIIPCVFNRRSHGRIDYHCVDVGNTSPEYFPDETKNGSKDYAYKGQIGSNEFHNFSSNNAPRSWTAVYGERATNRKPSFAD